jgi:hypothetical protein
MDHKIFYKIYLILFEFVSLFEIAILKRVSLRVRNSFMDAYLRVDEE